ncbi:MAG: hypothetical protein ACOCNR_07135, partial [Prevotella pectinovora]
LAIVVSGSCQPLWTVIVLPRVKPQKTEKDSYGWKIGYWCCPIWVLALPILPFMYISLQLAETLGGKHGKGLTLHSREVSALCW